MDRQPSKRKRLPRHYYPIVFVWWFLWGIVGLAASVELAVNPYIGFTVGFMGAGLVEVYRLARAGY